MNNKSKRKKTFLIVAVCAIASILLLFPFVRQGYINSKVEGYYRDNKESFQCFVDVFKNLYCNGINTISYTDEQGLKLYSKDKLNNLDCKTEEYRLVSNGLKELKDKYQQNNDLPVFSFAKACFDDNGNMLLYFLVKCSEPFKKNNDSDEYRTCYYLIYIDDNYSGNRSPFSIDKFTSTSGIDQKPFEDNWYVWTREERTC